MGYITPSVEPTASRCRRLLVPSDTRMIAALYGQLLELTEAKNWEQTDGITVGETTDIWNDIFLSFVQGSFCMIGAIVPLLNDSVPDSMLLCDGSTFLEVDYPELYAVLPAALQIDPDTGQLPDLRDSFILAAGTSHTDHDTGGAEDHTLSTNEMPAHTHNYNYNSQLIIPTGVEFPNNRVIPAPVPTPTSSAGGDAAHNNMPPFYVLKYAVVAL